MSNLVESILAGDLLSASQSFEEQVAEIMEKKLCEKKKMMQAEAMGGRTIDQAIKDMKARGLNPQPAHKVLGDPRDKPLPPIKRKKKVSEETLDEAGLSPTKIGKFYRAGLKTGAALGGLYGKYKAFKGKESPSQFPKDMHDTQAPKSDYEDTPTGRNRKKADAIAAAHPPGGAVVGATKYLSKKIPGAVGRVAGEIASYSNLEE